MSKKTIPPEIWPTLQKLTVKPSRLPKTVYRGLFFDGAKIKDKNKWLQQWAVGSKPNAKPTKVQSWSTSIGVASQFMDAQDFIKDQENGYAVMLKYEIDDPSIVIADFRNLKDNRFWNQQEILLSPAARNYEVVAVIPYENYHKLGKSWDETDLRKYQAAHGAPGASASGVSYNQAIVGYFFDINNMQIDSVEKENLRQMSKMTVSQAKKKYKFQPTFYENIEDSFDRTAMPLYALVASNNKHFESWAISIEQATGLNTVDAYIKTDNPEGFTRSSKAVSQLFKNIKFSYNDAILLPVTITLDNNDYNNMKFSINPTSRFFIGSRDRYSGETSESESEGAIAANKLIRSNPEITKKLKQEIRDSIEQSDINQKKNVTIELK